jgi:hypothetical protein
MEKIFIHTNNKQLLGAKLAKFAIERKLSRNIPVDYINVDELNIFKSFSGKRYLRNGAEISYDPSDLQSFTLSRFMPPELMNYQGKAVVIDPDIFALSDIAELFDLNIGEATVACCSKKGAWDSSVMLMDCNQLQHWNMETFLKKLENKELDYVDIMQLRKEGNVYDLPRVWNSLDEITPETMMLHTTNRLTQPWKTGLPIDFERNPLPKLFGIIPREPIHKLLGKYPTKYLPHPDKNIENLFFALVKEALGSGKVTESEVQYEISQGHVRADLLEKIK